MSPTNRSPGSVGGEVPPDQVRCRRGDGVGLGQGSAAPAGQPDDPAFARDPFDAFVVDHPAPAAQFDGDPRAAVGVAVPGMNPGDLGGQFLLRSGARGPDGGGCDPLVEPGASHTQDPAQQCDSEAGAVFGDEPVAAGQRPISCAKQGGRFPQNLLLHLQFRHPLTQRPQLVLIGAARHTRRLPGPLLRGCDPVAQGLMIHTQVAGDLTQRTVRGADQLHRVLAELLGILRRT